ncbi:MAG TPA: DUF4326 domain-containing protein [Pseudonocardia sp.]
MSRDREPGADRPTRLRRSRAAGWRMPTGSVYVGRPTRWGNPWRIGPARGGEGLSRAAAMQRYRAYLDEHPDLAEAARRELAGHDLVCWCPLDEPCHADELLRVANGDPAP